MPSAGAKRGRVKQVPQLAPGWEGRALALSPAEGFLLSRIDGTTAWPLLREIGGLAPDEADRCLERWVADGLVTVSGNEAVAIWSRAGARLVDVPAGGKLEADVDPELDIPVEAQRRVLLFEAGLGRPYQELLGVGAGVDAKAIKRAYFQLSKEYHPDRYYRREIGPYAEKLDRIFKKIVEAYELLMDPNTRAELERSMAGREGEPAPAAPPAGDRVASARAAQRDEGAWPGAARSSACTASSASRTRSSRAARKGPEFTRGVVAAKKQRWLEAPPARGWRSLRPWSDEYKALRESEERVNEIRAVELIEKAESMATDTPRTRRCGC